MLSGISNAMASFAFGSPVAVLDDQLLTSGGARSLSTSSTYRGQPLQVNITATVAAVGNTTLPIGSYSNCKDMRLNFNLSMSGVSIVQDSTHWVLAPSVGIIKDDTGSWGGISDHYFELRSGFIDGVPIGPTCAYNLTSSLTNHSALAASGRIFVTASSGCIWSATPNNYWLHTTSGGSGNGVVYYSVDSNYLDDFRTGTITVGGQTYTITQAPYGFSWQPRFGWVFDAGGGWYHHNGFGWVWFSTGQWIWSSSLNGWLATTDSTSSALWSTQFRWLTPSATDAYKADTTSIGPVYLGKYIGTAIPDSWVVSDRFGYVWANGDGQWFYSNTYGWLGVTPEGGIWCVNQGKFL
jgi:hypothetical protein